MGIFSFLNQQKNMTSAGGNFGFIAQNIATIYYVLDEIPFGKDLDEEKKLFATGILDAISYLNDGTMTVDDIERSVALGVIGEVSLGFYSVKHRKMGEYDENCYLLGLAMQLEAQIFEASDTGIGYRDIVDQVVLNKKTISDMINKTLAQGKNSLLYQSVFFNVSNWVADPNIAGVINNYSVK